MGITSNTERFDGWIRASFVEMNTELEALYWEQENRAAVEGVGDGIKQRLLEEGRELIATLLTEGNTDEGFDAGFDLLGNVGLYMGACRRHELTEPSRERTSPLQEASALAMQLGASLGVTPRFATSHLSTHNLAIDGVYRSFTSLEAEFIFLEYNTRAIFAYKRAADALVRTLHLGVSHPVTFDLLDTAATALEDVIASNRLLFEKLDEDRFFFCVRPYYKPYRVGLREYRGANAGDFAGINEIDLVLGLCQADNASYSQLLVDKLLYMQPDDQARLRDVMRRVSLMDGFLAHLDAHSAEPWFRNNLGKFLDVCETHGATASQHHDLLVSRFIEKQAQALPAEFQENITASGPPLQVVISALEKLRDLRLAADRDDIATRYHDLERLRTAIG